MLRERKNLVLVISGKLGWLPKDLSRVAFSVMFFLVLTLVIGSKMAIGFPWRLMVYVWSL